MILEWLTHKITEYAKSRENMEWNKKNLKYLPKYLIVTVGMMSRVY